MRKAIFRHGTAADSAKVADGYTPNGESTYSRRAAHPDHVRLKGYVKKHGSRATNDNAKSVRVQEIEIERLQRKTTNEHDPAKLAKLRNSIAIKQAFVERLKQEDEEGVLTIPGEFDIEPWGNIR